LSSLKRGAHSPDRSIWAKAGKLTSIIRTMLATRQNLIMHHRDCRRWASAGTSQHETAVAGPLETRNALPHLYTACDLRQDEYRQLEQRNTPRLRRAVEYLLAK